MKSSRHIFITLLLAIGFSSFVTSCNYLDIIPDGTATEKDAFNNPKATERYLYSCYGYIPSPSNGTGSIDFLGGDEVVTPFAHETPSRFNEGIYTATNPILSYWNNLFAGIRYCYTLIEKVDEVPNLDAKTAADYKAQAKFLIAYFHHLLIQSYGPTIIVEGIEDVNAPVEDFRGRATMSESVNFTANLYDEAAAGLPATRDGNEYGLATSVAAKAMKAKLLVLHASPLFNGYAPHRGITNPDGTPIFEQAFSQDLWDKAFASTKEAVRAAELAGHALFVENGAVVSVKEPVNMVHRSLRLTTLESSMSTETIWGDTRGQGYYDIQGKSIPYAKGNNADFAWGGVSPTLAMMERFYTENGLPLAEDPTFAPKSEWWTLIDVPADFENAEDRIPNFLYKREPRLYAWTTFHNGFYEVQGNVQNTNYASEYHRGVGGAKIVMKMLIGQPSGRGASLNTIRNNDYSPAGFLNKRLVHPLETPDYTYKKYIHPFITIADVYLLHAEAAVEVGNLAEAKTYLDKIRTRAGIPTVDAAWAKAKNSNKATTKEGMREIVRQERMIEMYLLNQNFWDMRRWLLAEKYFSVKPMGMNILSTTLEEFVKPTEVDVSRSFVAPRNYLLPIPQGEVNKNGNLVQNPGY